MRREYFYISEKSIFRRTLRESRDGEFEFLEEKIFLFFREISIYHKDKELLSEPLDERI